MLRSTLIRDIAVEFLQEHETFFPEAQYSTLRGRLTIGYGETDSLIIERSPITKAMAIGCLREHVIRILRRILQLTQAKLTPNQYAALIVHIYDIGYFTFRHSPLETMLRERDFENVPNYLLTLGINRPHFRLTSSRRAAERELWLENPVSR